MTTAILYRCPYCAEEWTSELDTPVCPACHKWEDRPGIVALLWIKKEPTVAGLGRKGGGRCGEASIGQERSGSVVPGCPGVHRVSDSRTTGKEKGGGYSSDAVCRGLFRAGGRES
ncbi:MAG TPA: hypothetical protein VMW58_09275 [Anaerolineae bacterium]|nr:hypothetical protein [Anaerolineae bacterium]